MAIIKCKMCGGELLLEEGASTAECEYCGSVQTVPKVDDEKKLTLFARANRLRAACEFDKAAGIYESIVADFPEEAEAYWGLVLCKYGIEYVDDPATGKKIPTCHRSSFDSIMEDADFEQALENADTAAHRIYREEAKQFERIRKGILEVSSAEKPYDIFICYKETSETGDRTLDSVLAQDLYSALTDKGYRVFFSRITLQSKLGEAYEPYIFAALNSAKVMLAVGTCYEHYNAVWVKNEWSRYLKICQTDKSKHLIPCYKDLDPEDMPKEFNHLQGADLGKMGAVQDILFNMEKYIPLKKETTTVIQEKVVVGGGGNNKIAALLDRGNMALEDGDWAKADSFFEDVLNNDSKNAQAYLGKTLAQERCRTIDAFVRKRKDATQNASFIQLSLPQASERIKASASRNALRGFVSESEIYDLYYFELAYPSQVAERKQQYAAEVKYWETHKLLSRAEKFATGTVAENLAREKQALFSVFADRVKKAEEAEAAAKAEVQSRYESHLKQADEKAETLYNKGLALRARVYSELVEKAKNSSDVTELTGTAKKFDNLGDYQDSRDMAKHCRKRAEEETAILEKERMRLALLAIEESEKRERHTKKVLLITLGALVAVIATIFLINTVIIPSLQYNAALSLMETGKYSEAVAAFDAMNGFRDSDTKSKQCQDIINENKYNDAVAMKYAKKYAEAIAAFEALADYKDSAEQISQCRTGILDEKYNEAAALETAGDTRKAMLLFMELEDFRDAAVRCDALAKTLFPRPTISAGRAHIAALTNRGTVIATGASEDRRCNVSDWENVVAVFAENGQTFGLQSNGAVLSVGYNKNNQCDVSDWEDIISLSVSPFHTVGLKADGTVVAAGWNEYGQCDVSDWTDIVAISTGESTTIGLKSDGTVVAVGSNDAGECKVSGWKDIVAICASDRNTIGLKADGTVRVAGNNSLGQYEAIAWRDIVAISADAGQIVGLRSDGTVVAVGNNDYEQCNLEDWTNVAAVYTRNGHVVGLCADGTVLATGMNDSGQCNVSAWRNIVAIAVSDFGTMGLTKNGQVLFAGYPSAELDMDLTKYTGIKQP